MLIVVRMHQSVALTHHDAGGFGPAFGLKRRSIGQKYAIEIDEMYRTTSAPATDGS